jgi:hypothetical protein
MNLNFNFQLTRKRKLIIAGVLLTPILLFALYTWSVLRNYSEERAGFVQNSRRKGWLCKTGRRARDGVDAGHQSGEILLY